VRYQIERGSPKVVAPVVVGINGRLMTLLGAKYVRDLVNCGRSKHTQEAYTTYVCELARYYRRSPELISREEVTGWLYPPYQEAPTVSLRRQHRGEALRFLYAVTLGRDTVELMASVPT
jgi:integrase/recombinase XerD